jgi:hypothetical protein
MMQPDIQPEPPALVLPAGPFRSSCGPADGPIRERHDLPGCIGVHPANPADASIGFRAKWQCGIACARPLRRRDAAFR